MTDKDRGTKTTALAIQTPQQIMARARAGESVSNEELVVVQMHNADKMNAVMSRLERYFEHAEQDRASRKTRRDNRLSGVFDGTDISGLDGGWGQSASSVPRIPCPDVGTMVTCPDGKGRISRIEGVFQDPDTETEIDARGRETFYKSDIQVEVELFLCQDGLPTDGVWRGPFNACYNVGE